VEGSIAKYFATEAGDAMANNAIQALGGYGYIREFEVEKIKRDLKITTIFEGTSEIQRSIISTFRLRETVRSKGRFYLEMAESLQSMGAECGAPLVAASLRVLNDLFSSTRKQKLTRLQHVMFLLADMITWCEVGEALCRKAATHKTGPRSKEYMEAAARLFAGQVVEKLLVNGSKIAWGCGEAMDEMLPKLKELNLRTTFKDYLKDMGRVAAELSK
jgi:alkylation response protein AidB-like acyl-CoA dehydrogenase